MYGVFACWVVVLALVLDRTWYWSGHFFRRPASKLLRELRGGSLLPRHARAAVREEISLASRNLDRLNAFSQLATSIGLFGTVVGIAQGFFASGGTQMSASAALVSGLSTALFTTIGGMAVFIFGQVGLIVFQGFHDAFQERTAKLDLEVEEIDREHRRVRSRESDRPVELVLRGAGS
jgi:biopolymer transport protein ExbB/TolQ